MSEAVPDGLVRIAPGNELPLHVARERVTAAVRQACASGARGLLADFHDWRGGQSPSLAMRIDSTKEWAAAAASVPGFALALVMPPEMVDPGRIGPILGSRLGFRFDVFGDVDEALAWLTGELEASRPQRRG
ncbi:hypothetical protein [Lysobacter sp. N42]|jgi:hypothetical protein|uniref:hypothetical protein n=1 Tax=Lysobacter sp. N42 TaxID=2545719 RepID=UPI00104CBFD1|nr:hypothetical protein [Lysobacter sp. N42]TCZ87206.1 hypothetical protein EYQ95_16780 [Lysobacter sp. N42]